MSTAEELFHKITKEIHGATEGRMFGAMCIKSVNGKVAAIFWKNSMLFKLGEQESHVALELEGTQIGFHLYAPDKSMKGWGMVPAEHISKWKDLTMAAILHTKEHTK